MIDEELSFRSRISGTAIKDETKIISLPPNDFTVMDDKVCIYKYTAVCTVIQRWDSSNLEYILICFYDSRQATDYDDMRCCCVCNQACIFTAVACECDQKNVSCVRHYSLMCRCTKEKRFMLGK